MEQMMKRLLAKADSNIRNVNPDGFSRFPDGCQPSQKEMKAAIRSQKESEAKTEEETKACLGKRGATIKTGQKQIRVEITACLKEMKATESEANQEKIEAVENHYNRAYCLVWPVFRWTKNP
jgi:hypothetical protein